MGVFISDIETICSRLLKRHFLRNLKHIDWEPFVQSSISHFKDEEMGALEKVNDFD